MTNDELRAKLMYLGGPVSRAAMARIDALEQELSEARQQLSLAEENLRDAPELAKAITDVVESSDADEITALREQLSEAREEAAAAVSTMETAVANLQEQGEQLSEARKECDDLKKQLHLLLTQSETAQQIIGATTEVRELVAKEVVSLRSELSEAQQECERLRAELQNRYEASKDRVALAVERAESAERERNLYLDKADDAILAAVERAEKAEAERDRLRNFEAEAAQWKEEWRARGEQRDCEKAKRKEAERAAAASAAQVERLREVLRSVEWRGVKEMDWTDESHETTETHRTCIECRQRERNGHKPDCRLAAALSEQPPADHIPDATKKVEQPPATPLCPTCGNWARSVVGETPPEHHDNCPDVCGACGVYSQGKDWRYNRCPNCGEMRDDMAGFAIRALGEQHPAKKKKCCHCGKDATCYGTYEGITAYACDDCCGHGCEDGKCEPVGEQPGVESASEASVCPRCEGSGRYSSLGEPSRECAVCNGTGKIVAEPTESEKGGESASELTAAELEAKATPAPLPVCMVTRNQCGTDTWGEGYECGCSVCQTWLRTIRDIREGRGTL